MQHQSNNLQYLATLEATISVPTGYKKVSERQESQDGVAVDVVRYERADGHNRGLGGEHFTIVKEAQTDRLKGVTWMDASLADVPLPSQNEAQQVAEAFLASAAPDLVETLTILWIAAHDETLQANGEVVMVTGMKVKCRQQSGTYAWVIVSSEGRVMTFERDIVWNSDMSKRMTEKWLHDSWLKERID